MKRLVWVVGMLTFGFMPTLTWAAIAEVGSGTQRAEKTADLVDSTTLAFPAAVQSGSLLVVAGGVFTVIPGDTITVTDTLGTSYTVLKLSANPAPFIAYGFAPSGGANTVTVDPGGIDNFISFSIDEFSGVAALDVDGGSSTGTNTAPQDSLTTLTANDLLIGVMVFSDLASVTLTPGTNYTQIGEEEDDLNHQAHNAEFRLVTTAQSYTVDWTTGVSVTWFAYTAAFQPTTSGQAGGITPLRSLLGVGQ